MSRIMLDPGHINKPDRPGDRGAVHAGLEEADLASQYLAAADRRLRQLGHQVLLGGGPGTYAERVLMAHRLGCDLYVQGHVDAGLAGRTSGDRGTVIHDHRSRSGAALSEAVAFALGRVCPWVVRAAPARPDDDGQPRDEDLSEAFACISTAYALKPVALLLEPGFIDGPAGAPWLSQRANLLALGAALADGIHTWST